MRKLVGAFALIGSGVLVSCSSADEETTDQPSETISSTQAPIVGNCTVQTFGLPCDPDGPLGPKLECSGYCWYGQDPAVPYCFQLAPSQIVTNDGKACGTAAGVGNAACTNHCQNGACISGDAKQGAACRPTTLSDACDGECSGTGACLPIATLCKFGVDNCKFDACDPLNASTCKVFNLLAGTECEDANGCTINDKCGANGTCAPGAPKSCNDNNVCTNDTCNPSNGACIGTNNTNPCSDNNQCTTGDVCSAGVCKVGTGTLDCDDNNPCTADSCDAATGCKHTPINCNDNNACTTDSCTVATGACANTPITCDDNDVCTTDSCANATGCVFAPIAGCGDSGTGGAGGSGGTAGGGTGGATGGTAGATGGTAGASGGAAGSGGTAGGAAGAAGSAGSGGSAGSSTGGGGGSGGSTGGSGGSGGSGGGSTGGSGGTATGGSGAQDAGTGGKKPSGVETEDSGGCGCRVPAEQHNSPAGLLLAALGALVLVRRQSSKR